MTEIIKNDTLLEQYSKTVLENGLTVLVYERPERTGAFATFCAKIGGVTKRFVFMGKEYDVPNGVAHFLEHKLFEGKDGEDAFSLFAKTGADANAFTGFDSTCYLFSANDNIPQSLRILLQFVSSPYFTPENVAKEQGIIGQEIKMYDDSDQWQLIVGALRLMYEEHQLRSDIAGTVESIAQITDKTLYDCYNAFYNPANMVLAVCGNITTQQVIEICRECLDMSVRGEAAVCVDPQEPPRAAQAYGEKEMSISSREFALGFKEIPMRGESLKQSLLLKLITESLFGTATDFYRKMYDDGLLNQTFESSSNVLDDAVCTIITGESDDPQRVKEEIVREIKRAKQQGIDPQRFEEALRNRYGDEVLSYDSNENTALALAFSHFQGYNIYDTFDMLSGLSVADADALLRQSFCPERTVMYVLNPKER